MNYTILPRAPDLGAISDDASNLFGGIRDSTDWYMTALSIFCGFTIACALLSYINHNIRK